MEAEESRFIRKVACKHACFMRKQEVGGARSKRAIPAHAFYFFFREIFTPYYEEEVLWEHVYYVEDYGFESHPFLLFFTPYNGGGVIYEKH